MNWLDFAIIFVLIGFVAAAYAAGLIREAVMDDEDAAQAISFLILVGAVYMFGQIIALMLSRTASLLMLGWADRAGGAVFGFLKGLLVVQALLIVLAAYPSLGMEDAVAGSQLAPYFVDDVDVLLWVLPDNFDSRIERFLAPQPPQSS